ncbi:hypothetical protein, partial [Frankia sp. EI5c]|uniref:hypothetical protein n=1 Tax=Frankia sp. EI5c TaxID=683316 RepID=UPI001A7E792D
MLRAQQRPSVLRPSCAIHCPSGARLPAFTRPPARARLRGRAPVGGCPRPTPTTSVLVSALAPGMTARLR